LLEARHHTRIIFSLGCTQKSRARRLATDETTVEAFLDAMIEVLYEAFKAGESVSLPGLGGFYVRPERDTWVFKFKPGQKLRATSGWSSALIFVSANKAKTDEEVKRNS
jgi:nucleoid DNA-binding protein